MKKNRKFNILVVDDEVDICRALEFLLIKEGYDVTIANTGEKGLELFDKKQFDLVLSDLKMPGMSGLDMMREILTRSAEMPVIIMTAFASVESAVEAMKLGASDYIVKPFDTKELKVRAKNLIDQRQKLRQRFSHKITLSLFL